MHNNLPSLKIIADIVQPYPVIVLEDPRTTISSVLGGGLKSSAIPRDLPKNTDLRYTTNDTIEEVSALFILADIPLPCINFCSGATILGNVETLRKILQGKKYYPIARGGDLVALELE